MLQAIRDNTRGWLAYLVVGIIAVPMLSFGLYSYFQGGGDTTVASVGDVEISQRQLSNAYQDQQQRLREMLGDRYDPAMFDETEMKRRVLDRLINQAVLTQFAQREGLRVGDQALAEAIRSQEFFQVDGEFSRERYQSVLSRSGLTPEAYEADLRRRQAVQQLQSGVVESVVVPDAELKRLAALQFQRRDVGYLQVSAEALADQVEVTDEEIRQFYQANQGRFQRPERVRLAYVELTLSDLVDKTELSEQQLRDHYQSIKDEAFTTPGKRKVSHILLGLPDDASEQEVEQARERLLEIRRKIAQGEAGFAEMAKAHSEDPGSAESGGDLGFIRRGDMVEPFEEAAYALEEGEISEPVRTDFGWHLIRATEVVPEKVAPFAEVKDEVRRRLAEEKLANQFYEISNEIANVAYESPDSLAPVAEQFDLAVKHTDWIPRGGTEEGLGSRQPVLEAAFSDEVLRDRYNSELIELSEERQVIVRVDEHQPAQARPLDEVRDQVAATLRQQQTAKLAGERAQELAQALREGADPGELAEPPAVTWTDLDPVTRDAAEAPRSVVSTAFQTPRPGKAGRSVSTTGLPDGSQAVVVVQGVNDGTLAELDAEQREQLRSRLRNLRAQAYSQSLVTSLRQEMDVTVNEERL